MAREQGEEQHFLLFTTQPYSSSLFPFLFLFFLSLSSVFLLVFGDIFQGLTSFFFYFFCRKRKETKAPKKASKACFSYRHQIICSCLDLFLFAHSFLLASVFYRFSSFAISPPSFSSSSPATTSFHSIPYSVQHIINN